MAALEVDFPEAGEGIVVRFRNSDCAKIQEKLGPGWLAEVSRGLDKFDQEIIELLANVGAKKDGESTFKLKMVDLDHVPLFDLARLMLDGLTLRLRGKLFEEWVKEVAAKEAERQAHEARRTV